MAGFLADRVYDSGLTILDTEANVLYICSAQPANFAGIAAVLLGTKTSLSIGSPGAGTPDGRKVTVAAFTDGSVSAGGTASHYAIADTVNSRLLATDALDATQVVTNGNTFSLPAFDIRIPAPA